VNSGRTLDELWVSLGRTKVLASGVNPSDRWLGVVSLAAVNRPKESRNPNQLQFLTSAVNLDGCPSDTELEVAIIGRSNAGKSSLINGLARARIALVSSTPGKTRLLNFYKGPKYRVVDMPGYGFAARSRGELSAWQTMIEPFLAVRANLVGLVIVMDIRRDWSEEEEALLRWLAPRELPAALVLSKADKLSRSQVLQRTRLIMKASGVEHILITSALKKEGFVELEEFLYREWVKPEHDETRGKA
jgi:GTP-binding protein